MRSKNGFTLVELLVTVGLLAGLSLIIILNLNSNLKKQKEKDYQTFIDKIISATNVYWSSGEEKRCDFENNKFCIISLKKLELAGLINMNILKNPMTGLSLNSSSDEMKYVKIYKDISEAVIIEYPIKDLTEGFYRIDYELNGGLGCETQYVLIGDSALLCNAAKKKSANLVGWYFDDALKNRAESYYTPISDVVLYAKWQEYYTVIYHLDNDLNSQCNTAMVNKGDSFVLCNPIKEHYTFDGWYDSDKLNNKVGNANSNIMIFNDLDLYPKWTRKKYSVVFDLAGGDVGNCDKTNMYVNAEDKIGALCIPVKTGYKFLGWNDGLKNYDKDTKVLSDITLTALWEAKKYTISLDSNGITTNGSKTVQVTYNGLIDKFINHENENYELLGWFTDTSGGYKVIDNKGALLSGVTGYTNSLGWIKDDNVTLYAHWKDIMITCKKTEPYTDGETYCGNKYSVSSEAWCRRECDSLGRCWCSVWWTGCTKSGLAVDTRRTITKTQTKTKADGCDDGWTLVNN